MELSKHQGFSSRMAHTMFLLLISLTGILDVTASVLLRVWVANNRLPFLLAGIAIFGLAGLMFAFAMRYEGLAVANVIWIGASIILVSVVGVFAFGEHLSARQLAGMTLVLVGICLVGG